MEKQPIIKTHLFFPAKDVDHQTVEDSSSSASIFESFKVSKEKEGEEEVLEYEISTEISLSFWSEKLNNKRKFNSAESSHNKKDEDTTLKLYDHKDPWKIKKILTYSELSRLLLSNELVKKHVLPVLPFDEVNKVESEDGIKIKIWDMDIGSKQYELVLKRWASSKCYVLNEGWTQDFVKRRELNKEDEIGFHWDSSQHRFNFSVLKIDAN
ncbi:B3 domain-containing protein [Quillaja saponaria]|uniref:B3 domain-containing protein n=1 Tax=Quillaja saponaria TaxID=32244 RepID=A0AAD7LAV7_QUISA|nr:B3 domain-containing protein [Quillaja saponaria]